MSKKSKYLKVFTYAQNFSKRASNLINLSQFSKRKQEKKYARSLKSAGFQFTKPFKAFRI
jgi:hypothetical protein